MADVSLEKGKNWGQTMKMMRNIWVTQMKAEEGEGCHGPPEMGEKPKIDFPVVSEKKKKTASSLILDFQLPEL